MKINAEPLPQDYDYKAQVNCSDLDHIPGTYGLPFLGHGAALYNDLRGLCNDLHNKYGTVTKFNMMGAKGVMVFDVDAQREILLDRYQAFSNEKAYENTLGKFFQGGLLLIDFDEHKTQRRIFQTAFKNDAMKTYVERMNEIMAEHIASWQPSDPFVFFPHIKECLLSTGSKIFIGVEDSADIKFLNKNFIDMFEGMTGLIQLEIPGTKWFKAKRALRNLHDFYETLIPERRANPDGKDLLSYLCKEKKEDGSYFTNDEIVGHINFLLMAAHDTTAASLVNIIMELAKKPEWQERLRKQAFEMDKEFIEYADLDAMIDIDNAMLEAQRLHPSIPMTWRRSIKDCEIDGKKIPKNTILFMPALYHYRDPKWWTNPEDFDPDRFLPERAEDKQHKFLFIPFGGGAHKCIGMHFAKIQVKCFLHQFLKQYKFTVEDGYDPKLMIIPMPKPTDDLPLKLERI